MTRSLWLTLAVIPFVSGCGRTPDPQFRASVGGPIAMARGTAEAFVPLVPSSSRTPRCEDLRDLPGGMGPRVVSFIFGDEPEQRIAVALGDDGVPRNYSDMRGDLNASDGREGALTTIAINLVQGHAFAHNRPEGGDPEGVRLDLEDALDAVALGGPRQMMERILADCTGGLGLS